MIFSILLPPIYLLFYLTKVQHYLQSCKSDEHTFTCIFYNASQTRPATTADDRESCELVAEDDVAPATPDPFGDLVDLGLFVHVGALVDFGALLEGCFVDFGALLDGDLLLFGALLEGDLLLLGALDDGDLLLLGAFEDVSVSAPSSAPKNIFSDDIQSTIHILSLPLNGPRTSLFT